MWNKIEKLLKEKQINQAELSRRMNLHTSTITDLKKGRIKKPSFELVCKIADALDVSLDDLRKDKEE